MCCWPQVLPHNMKGRLSHWPPALKVPQETPGYVHAPGAWESIRLVFEARPLTHSTAKYWQS